MVAPVIAEYAAAAAFPRPDKLMAPRLGTEVPAATVVLAQKAEASSDTARWPLCRAGVDRRALELKPLSGDTSLTPLACCTIFTFGIGGAAWEAAA